MNCNEVTPLLSPFHDGELLPDQRRAVSDHVATCASCSDSLESIRRLTDLVESTPTPEAPATLVSRVERSLNKRAPYSTWFPAFTPQQTALAGLVAIATVVLIGLAIWNVKPGATHSHEEMARLFGEFIDSYEQGSSTAEDLLARRYEGILVNEAAATSALKRPTVARPVVLSDHRATKRYVLKMPCCDCVQTVYTSNGATSFVVFEHDKEQPEWFNKRPMIRAECRGESCCMVQLSRGLAATWPVAGGFVTVVGLRDVAELGNLVDELKPPPIADPSPG